MSNKLPRVVTKVRDHEVPVDKQNYRESLKAIEAQLEPGMPVLMTNFESHDHFRHGRVRSEQILFFSDGTVVSEPEEIEIDGQIKKFECDMGKLGIMGGKYNHIYAILYPEAGYRLVHGFSQTQKKITIPWSGSQPHYNENTFSPAGGSTEMVFSSGGTSDFEAGEQLAERFAEALAAIEFARDAINFTPPDAYFAAGSFITELGVNRKEQEAENSRLRKIETIAFALKVLRHALIISDMKRFNAAKKRDNKKLYDIPINDCSLGATQVAYYRDGKDGVFSHDDHAVGPNDYIVAEAIGPHYRRIGYLKTAVGGSYFLPEKGMVKVVELAFSEDHVNSIYPGFKSPEIS